MSRPRLLDLFCGAGGAAMGYHRAGFDVVGVDIEPQPRYPFEFVQDNAVAVLACFEVIDGCFGPFDAIHASPPCQFSVSLSRLRGAKPHENLIPVTRELLDAVGLPYVIENVPTSAEYMRSPVTVCGYGLGLPIRRHRVFECTFPVMGSPCRHDWPGGRPVAVYGQNGRALHTQPSARLVTCRALRGDGHRLDDERRADPGDPPRLHRAHRPLPDGRDQREGRRMNRLADRVRELMDERAATALLYPARHIQAAPINPPLNHEHPGQLAEADGVRGLLDVPNSTP